MEKIPFIIIACMAVFLIIVKILIKTAVDAENKIREEGLFEDAVVHHVDSKLSDNPSGHSYNAYVSYIGNDGLEHIGLLNVRSNFPTGRRMKIQYLPGKYDSVVFISQELE